MREKGRRDERFVEANRMNPPGSGTWYYLLPLIDGDDIIAEVIPDEETLAGPIELSQLTELVRNGWLPDGVMISRDRSQWNNADRVVEVLRALPLDIDRISREYEEWAAARPGEGEAWGWAGRRLYHLRTCDDPDFALEIVAELIDRALSVDSLGLFAAGPLEDLLSDHGPHLIARVEHRARRNPKFLRALRGVWRHGMADDVWERIQRLKKSASGSE